MPPRRPPRTTAAARARKSRIAQENRISSVGPVPQDVPRYTLAFGPHPRPQDPSPSINDGNKIDGGQAAEEELRRLRTVFGRATHDLALGMRDLNHDVTRHNSELG